jgi:hypothetical protein
MSAPLAVLDVPAGTSPGVDVQEVTTMKALLDAFAVFQDDGWFDGGEAATRVAVAARLRYGSAPRPPTPSEAGPRAPSRS